SGTRERLYRISSLRRAHHLGSHGSVGGSKAQNVSWEPGQRSQASPSRSRLLSNDSFGACPRVAAGQSASRHPMGEADQNSKQTPEPVLGSSDVFRSDDPSSKRLRAAPDSALSSHLSARAFYFAGSVELRAGS